MLKWKDFDISLQYRANGYTVVLFPLEKNMPSKSSWYGLNSGHNSNIHCFYTSYTLFNWSTKKCKRKALKHLFKLPKLN